MPGARRRNPRGEAAAAAAVAEQAAEVERSSEISVYVRILASSLGFINYIFKAAFIACSESFV